MNLLEVDGLVTRFELDSGPVHAVQGISYTLDAGEAVAIVGESGSGKTVGALSLLGLVPSPGRIVEGAIRLGGRDITGQRAEDWSDVRGRRISMVFQDPMTSLNPVLTVGRQITEALELHLGLSGVDAKKRAVHLLERVGIPNAGGRLKSYPHELSGGQRQRVMIAMAISCEPEVLIADEPTTALDVTIQAQIAELIRDLQSELGMAVLWITHDLALASTLVDRVLVMYAGRIVEDAPVEVLFTAPRHPYTLGLLGSMPVLAGATGRRLPSIPGSPPSLARLPQGCAFAPRCTFAEQRCRAEPPPPEGRHGHRVACWRSEERTLREAVRSRMAELDADPEAAP